MKKLYAMIAAVGMGMPCGAQHIALQSLKTAAGQSAGETVTVLSEDFSLLTAGAEDSPAAEELNDDNYSVPASKTHTPGWQGYYLHEAGGMLYVGLSSNGMESGVVNTPKVDLTAAGGAFTVKFRARSEFKDNSDKIYIDSKASASDYNSAEVKISGDWADYEVKFENGSATSYVMFSPWLDGIYIDDITIEMLIPAISAPKNLSFSNYTVTGFDAAWDGVEGATAYLVSVYTKDVTGRRTYAIKDKTVEGTSLEVRDLPAVDSYWHFTVKATDGENISPESVETAVEALLMPVLAAETEVSATGFTANWGDVANALSYHFITYREHTATGDETFPFINEDFSAYTEKATLGYDYTSIPELPGWTLASACTDNGQVGVKSANGQYGEDAWIQSVVYDFSKNGGKVDLRLDVMCNHKKYTSDILVGLYTYDPEHGRFRLADYEKYTAVGKDGIVIERTLEGGGERSLIQIEPDGYADMMINSMEISQQLSQGDTVELTVVSKSTEQPTAGARDLTLAAGDRVSYTVRAVGRNATDTGNIYSDYTPRRYVTMATSGCADIDADGTDAPAAYFNLQGQRVDNPDKGLYIKVQGDKAEKVIM